MIRKSYSQSAGETRRSGFLFVSLKLDFLPWVKYNSLKGVGSGRNHVYY